MVRGPSSPRNGDDVFTAEEAAKFLKVSRKTLYHLVKNAGLPGKKVGRAWRFRKEDLEAYLRDR
jgi:excisionase family DNA binding protein